jgi:HYR domain
MRLSRAVALSAVVAAAFASAIGAANARITAVTTTLELRGALRLVSIRDTPCPPGTKEGMVCPGRTGLGLVPGIGRVSEAYTFLADTAHPACSAGAVRILGYPVRWVVSGKGEIHFVLAENPDCLSDTVAFTAGQSYTITGGTGLYAGASGSGRVERSLTQNASGAAGPETWTGTLDVAGVEFDLTAPTIAGATSKTLRAPRRTTRVRVTYAPTATDNKDGAIPVICRPRSGSRFKVGRTIVRCTASDTSGNTATAAFTVTVRRRR